MTVRDEKKKREYRVPFAAYRKSYENKRRGSKSHHKMSHHLVASFYDATSVRDFKSRLSVHQTVARVKQFGTSNSSVRTVARVKQFGTNSRSATVRTSNSRSATVRASNCSTRGRQNRAPRSRKNIIEKNFALFDFKTFLVIRSCPF